MNADTRVFELRSLFSNSSACRKQGIKRRFLLEILNFINRKATCSDMLERRGKVNRKAAQHLNGRWTVRQVVRSRDYRSSLLDLIKVHVPVAWTMLEDCA